MRQTFAFSAIIAGAAIFAPGAVMAQDTRTEALGAMNMITSGSGVFRFSSAQRDGAADVFSNVTIAGADDLSIDSLRIEGARMEGGRPVFDALVFQGLSGPIEGQSSATSPVGGKGPGAEAAVSGEPGSMIIDEVRLRGPNVETAAAIAQALFQPGGAPELSYQGVNAYSFEEIAIEGLSASMAASNGETGVVSLGALTFNGLAQGSAQAVQLSNLNMNGTFGMDGDPTPISLSLPNFSLQNIDFGALEAAAGQFNPAGLGEVAIGEFLLQGLVADTVTEDGEAVQFNIGEIRLNDWGPLGASLVRLTDINLGGTFDIDGQVSPVEFSLDSYELNGLNLRHLAPVYQSFGRDMASMNALARAMVVSPFEPIYDSYRLSGFNADVAGITVSLAEARGQVSPNRAGFDYSDTFGPLNVSFDPSSQAGAQAMMALGMIGVSQIEITAVSQWMANQVEDRIRSQEYRLSMTDGFDLSAEYDLSNVSAYFNSLRDLYGEEGFEAAMGDDPEAIMQALGDLTFNTVSVTYEDQGIAPRILALAAPFLAGNLPQPVSTDEDDKGPGEDTDAPSDFSLGGQVGALIRAEAQNEPPGAARDLVMSFAAAAETFLNDPQSFTVRMAPATPVSVSELNALGEFDPNAAVARLNITIEANGGR